MNIPPPTVKGEFRFHLHQSLGLGSWKRLVATERATMGKTTLRIYDEETMRVLQGAKKLMDAGMRVSDAFGRVRDEIERKERDHD